MTVWQQVEHMRRVYQDNGYSGSEMSADPGPDVVGKSGHWANYKDNMFTTEF